MFDAEKCRYGYYSDSTTMANSVNLDCVPLSGTYVTKVGGGATVSGTDYSPCPVGSYCLASSPISA